MFTQENLKHETVLQVKASLQMYQMSKVLWSPDRHTLSGDF